MTQKLLLIDFENVQQVDLSRLDGSTNIVIFVGASQKAIPFELVSSAQQLGARVKWQKVESNGNNSLDFHIACHLGRVLEKSPQLHCIVLSKDKGYDPLLRTLNKTGLTCKRIDSFIELDPPAAPVGGPGNKSGVVVMSKPEKKTNPPAAPVGGPGNKSAVVVMSKPEKKTNPQAAPVDEPNYKRVVEVLGKSEKKARPRKLKTLSQHILSICQKQIAQKDIERIIQMLIANKMISVTADAITYNF